MLTVLIMATKKAKKTVLASSLFDLMSQPTASDLIDVATAAKMRGVTTESIYQLISRGRLRAEYVLGRTLVHADEIKNFKKERAGRKPRTARKAAAE
jgi:hypothetical protein